MDEPVPAPEPGTKPSAGTEPAPDAPAPAGSPPPATCADCGAPLPGRFCARCGQDSEVDLKRPFRQFAGELVSETLSIDSRVGRTFMPFVLAPGRLTAEYLAGRRTRYSAPIRLYLAASLAFFLAGSCAPQERDADLRLGVKDGEVELQGLPGEPEDAAPSGDGKAKAGGSPASPAPGAAPAPPPRDEAADRAESDRTLQELAGSLRGKGRLGAFAAGRLDRIRGYPPGEAQRVFVAAFRENAPRAMFFLVPLLALFLKVLYPRRFYAEHLVLSLHAQSLGYLALLPGELTGWRGLGPAGLVATLVWLLVALRRVYGGGWVRTAVKTAALAFGYLVALGLALGALAVVAVLML